MRPKDLAISFTDSPEEEIKLVQNELSLSTIANKLELAIMKGEELTQEDMFVLTELVTIVREMFSIDLPNLGDSTEDTLRMSSRDINLSRLLRERGLVRIYRLLNEKTNEGVPLYMTYNDPYTGAPFQRKEDFIGWIAKDAHIPRSTLFIRFSTYDKLMSLSFDLEKAFKTVITKPYAMREVLNMAATWENGRIVDLDPEVVKQVATKLLPTKEAEEISTLANKYANTEDPVVLKQLAERYQPILKDFVEELAEHTNTKEMMDYVRHDVLSKPEISYSWVDDSLVMHVTRKAVKENGVEVIVKIDDIPFVPDYPGDLEDSIVDDLLNRLPIRNRREVIAERQRRKVQAEEDLDNLPF